MPDSSDRKGSTLPARLLFIFASLNLLFLITELALNIGKAMLPL